MNPFVFQAASGNDDISGLLIFFGIIAAGIIAAFVLSVVFRSRAMRRALWHKSPFPESGAEGPMKDLAPVEAGIVLSADISRLLAMYLLDLVSCKDIRILDVAPLKVEVLAQGDIPEFRKRFLAAVRDDGSLDPEKMLLALDYLYSNLKSRIQDYSVKETVIHYLDRVDNLWTQIQKERTTSARLHSLEEQFPWLLLHEDSADNLERMFSTSARWPTVHPIVKMLRFIRARIITNEDLLEHAASHPEGIFSNKSYREGIVLWARKYIRQSSSGEMWTPLPARYEVDPEKQAAMDKRREELKKKLDKMQHLLEIIEESGE